jgi:FAD binding domain/Berberine and berberine like
MSVSSAIRARDRQSKPLAVLEGKVFLAEHGAFDRARQAWNLAVDQRPAAVVVAESIEDVVATVQLAREHGLRVAAQGTGHGAAALGSLEDTILLRTDRLRAIQVDPERRIARLEAGVTWLDAVKAAAQHGLALLAGSAPDVGVLGYTLGGGLSWLGRKHGLAANSVQAIELVTADGRVLRADADHESDLFWALRGGGGNFGIVTAIELRALPITAVYAGLLWWPIERADEVLRGWRELTERELPDELTTVGRLLHLPELPEVPEPLRGRSFVVVEAFHLGEPDQADKLLAPLRALDPESDTLDVVPVETLSHLHMDPDRPVPVVGDGMLLSKLPAEAVDRLVRIAVDGIGSPLLSIEVRHLGGELARPQPGGGARSAIEAPYALFAVGLAPDLQIGRAIGDYIEHLIAEMGPWAATEMYLNFAETRRDPAALWSEHAYRRLRQIKARVDPDDVIRANHPVAPA